MILKEREERKQNRLLQERVVDPNQDPRPDQDRAVDPNQDPRPDQDRAVDPHQDPRPDEPSAGEQALSGDTG